MHDVEELSKVEKSDIARYDRYLISVACGIILGLVIQWSILLSTLTWGYSNPDFIYYFVIAVLSITTTLIIAYYIEKRRILDPYLFIISFSISSISFIIL